MESIASSLRRYGGLLEKYPRWTLLIFGLVVFGLVTRSDFSNTDTTRRLQVTHWLWTDQPQVLESQRVVVVNPTPFRLYSPGWCELRGKDGKLYAQFGLGQAVAMLPSDIFADWLTTRALRRLLPPSRDADETGGQYRTLKLMIVHLTTFSVISVLALVLSYELLTLLGFAPRQALPATMLLVAGTTFIVYMQDAQENGLIYLCYVGALVFLLRSFRRRPRLNLAIAGAFAGYALLIKLTDAVYLVPLLALALWSGWSTRRGEPSHGSDQRPVALKMVAVYFGAPVLIGLLIDRAYQYYRFGEWHTTYMKQCAEFFAQVSGYPPNYPFGYDALAGFFGPLFSTNYSVFLYDPLLAFALACVVLTGTGTNPSLRVVVFGSVAALLGLAFAFSRTYFWTGGLDWGPRHHLVPVEVICLIGFALLIRNFPTWKPWARALVVVNVVAAIAVQLLALPLRAFVEPLQADAGDPLGIFLLMRARNVLYLAAGRFTDAHLDYGSSAIQQTVTGKGTDQLLAFMAASNTPRLIAGLIIASWLLLVLVCVGASVAAVLSGIQQSAARPGDRVRA